MFSYCSWESFSSTSLGARHCSVNCSVVKCFTDQSNSLLKQKKEKEISPFPPRPDTLLFYSVERQMILLVKGEPLGGKGLGKLNKCSHCNSLKVYVWYNSLKYEFLFLLELKPVFYKHSIQLARCLQS